MQRPLQRGSKQIRPVLQSMNDTQDHHVLVFDHVEDVMAAAGHEAQFHPVDEMWRDQQWMRRNSVKYIDNR